MKRRIVYDPEGNGVWVEERTKAAGNPWVRISDLLPDETTASEKFKGAKYRGTGKP